MVDPVSTTAAPATPAAKALTRTEARQRSTRIRLRTVAHQLMAEQGVDATTIQQITDAADIGFGTFYNYYPTKEALAEDVLDCLIRNLGRRNDLVTQQLGETDPVRIVANSVRFVLRETTTDPVYRWWFSHLDLLADRMRAGFAPFGLRDIDRAVASGDYSIIGDRRDLAWSQLVWIMAAGARDIITGVHSADDEAHIVEGVLRVMGVDHDAAHRACTTTLPEAPALTLDFGDDLGDD